VLKEREKEERAVRGEKKCKYGVFFLIGRT